MKRIDKSIIMTTTILMILIGCGVHSSMNKPHTPIPLYKHEVPVYSPRQDTPKVKTRQWSAQQLELFISQQYQANYNRFFAPEFKRLNGVVDRQSTIIQNQAKSIEIQSHYLIEYRRRTDSIARERNEYRIDKQKAQDSQVYWQKRAIKSQSELIKFIKQQSEENKDQVDQNRILTVCCLIGVAIIAGLFLYLLYRIRSISKRVDGLLEHQSHV